MRTSTVAFGLVLVAVSSGAAACSITTIDSPPGGGTLADGATVGEDGAVLADGGVDGSAGAANGGTVSVTYSDFGAAKILSATAYFQRAGAAPVAPSSCTLKTIGDCVLYLCPTAPSAEAGSDDAGAASPSAGEIGLSGARIPSGTKLVPGADGKYGALTEPSVDAWSGGETIAITAKGGDVPAFSGSVTAPSPTMALTTPVFAPPAKLDVDRSRAFPLAWSGGGAGFVNVTVSSSRNTNGTATAVCRFEGAKGSAEIPAAVMSELPVGDGVIGASVASTTIVQAGEYAVTLLASSGIRSASGQVTFR